MGSGKNQIIPDNSICMKEDSTLQIASLKMAVLNPQQSSLLHLIQAYRATSRPDKTMLCKLFKNRYRLLDSYLSKGTPPTAVLLWSLRYIHWKLALNFKGQD